MKLPILVFLVIPQKRLKNQLVVGFTATASFGTVKLPSATLLTPMAVTFFGMCLHDTSKKLDPLEGDGQRGPCVTTRFSKCFLTFEYEIERKMKRKSQ